MDRLVCFMEVWCEENVEEGVGDIFDGISDWKDGDVFGL